MPINGLCFALALSLAFIVAASAFACASEEVDEAHARRSDFRPSPIVNGTAGLFVTLCLVLVLGAFVITLALALYFGWFGGLA